MQFPQQAYSSLQIITGFHTPRCKDNIPPVEFEDSFMVKVFLYIFGIQFVAFQLCAQVRLTNPSFEGIAGEGKVPIGWHICDKASTPDILPGPWNVHYKPTNGNTFLGLITREDNTWEYIAQKLTKPLLADECYALEIDLARAPTYEGYNKPIKLNIWGGTLSCARTELLAHTTAVEHLQWETYRFLLFPSQNYFYITFEAYYADDLPKGYKGNILLDNCSQITICERASL